MLTQQKALWSLGLHADSTESILSFIRWIRSLFELIVFGQTSSGDSWHAVSLRRKEQTTKTVAPADQLPAMPRGRETQD